MKTPAEKKLSWTHFRLQASNGFVALPNRLVDGKAFAALTTAAAVKTLVWFWQMVEYHKSRKKQSESSIGRIDKIKNNGEMSFTYQEAEWRGLKQGRFSRALKELFRLGFIDIRRHGRGVMGEYTKYALSNRWQKFGSDDWKEIPFPENFREGFRSDEFKEKRRKQSKKNSVRPCTLPTSVHARYEEPKSPHNVRPCTLETALLGMSQRAPMNVSIDLAMPIGSGKKVLKKVWTPNPRSKSIAVVGEYKFRVCDADGNNPFWAEDEPMLMSFSMEAGPGL